MFFLFRMLGLIRGLCTTLEVKLPYLEIMANYAQKGLVLGFERKVRRREGGKEGGFCCIHLLCLWALHDFGGEVALPSDYGQLRSEGRGAGFRAQGIMIFEKGMVCP